MEMKHDETCIFCKIARGEIPSPLQYQDEDFIVFPDLHPQAKLHWLIVPRAHYANILEFGSTEEGRALLSRLAELLPGITEKAGIQSSGFRLVVNTGKDGGQTVPHVHFHLLGGETLPV